MGKNGNTLFEGKAGDWFWRYRRSVSQVYWRDLCNSLRQQYGDSRTDVDLQELVRDRKWKINEIFYNFYESVLKLTDQTTLGLYIGGDIASKLVAEIQHEILKIEMKSLQNLGVIRS